MESNFLHLIRIVLWFLGTGAAGNEIPIPARVYCFQFVTTQQRVYYAKKLPPVS